MSGCERIGPLLDAYHDGELGRLRRARVRRHLAGCPGCREELASLRGIGAWVREAVAAPEAPPPELWSELRWLLPARARAAQAVESRAPRRRLLSGLRIPALGAGAAAAALALLALLAPPGLFGRAGGTVVRSLNTHGRPVMVLNGPDDATIIWLMDEEGVQGAEDSSSVWI